MTPAVVRRLRQLHGRVGGPDRRLRARGHGRHQIQARTTRSERERHSQSTETGSSKIHRFRVEEENPERKQLGYNQTGDG